MQLVMREAQPDISTLWYRYDPPVLIVAAMWHETEVRLSEHLHTKLALDYSGNADLVSIPRLLAA
jgi:hypothetical protein